MQSIMYIGVGMTGVWMAILLACCTRLARRCARLARQRGQCGAVLADAVMCTSLLAPIVLPLSLASCSCDLGTSRAGPAPSTPHKVIVFVDESSSVTAAERESWTRVIADDLCQPGTRLIVYPISDVTSGSASTVDVLLALPDRRSGMQAMNAAKARLARTREEVRSALASMVAPARRARWSDLLAIVDRIAENRPDSSTTVVVFSDAVHSMPALDLERLPISGSIEALVRDHRFGDQPLHGARVHFVLPSLQIGARPPVNDRKSLERWWSAIVHAAGGTLMRFSTKLELSGEG